MTVWHQDGGGPALVAVEVETSPKIIDGFGRTESNGWGTTDTGHAWTVTGGAASDYSTDGSQAAHSLGSVNVPRHSVVGSGITDVDLSLERIRVGVAPTGAAMQVGLLARYVDVNNYLYGRLFLTTSDTVLVNLRALVGGVEVTTSNVTVDGLTASASTIALRFQVEGTSMRARAWEAGTAEPDEWQVEMDHTGLHSGAVGVRSTLQTGNTNVSPSFTYDGFRAVYTERVVLAPLHTVGLTVDMAGRQTELDRTDNAALQLGLDNADGNYTPGYAYAATELGQGQRVWVKETVGRRSWDLFTGTMQQPEAQYGAHPNDAKVFVSAVDLFGEVESNGRTFTSTLGEYILDAGGSNLVGYWPIGEPSGATQAGSEVTGQEPLTIERRTDYDGSHAPVNSLLSFGTVAGPPMDDLQAVEFNPLRTTAQAVARDRLANRVFADVSFDDSEVVAISLWYRMSANSSVSDQAMVARDDLFSNSFNIITVGTTWTATFQTDAGTAQIAGSAIRPETWQLLTLHLNVASGVSSFWIDKQEYLGDVGGASTGSLDSIVVDGLWPGSAACHLQTYAGPAASVNRQLHLAQYEHGTNEVTGGLRFQRTDERFRTLCRYAGTPEPDCDFGTVWMPQAELAGSTLTSQLASIVETEQGRGFVSAAGVPQFHSRIRARYNL